MMSHSNSKSSPADNFIGCCVSFEMRGGMGYFQGIVIDIDSNTQELKLTDVINDGRPSKVKEMTFSAHQISGLEVLSNPRRNSTPSASVNSTRLVDHGCSSIDHITSNIQLQTLNDGSDSTILKNLRQQDVQPVVHTKTNDEPDAIQDFLSRTQSNACQTPPPKSSLACSKSLPPIVQEPRLETKGACGPLLEQSASSKKSHRKINEKDLQISNRKRGIPQAASSETASWSSNRSMQPQHQPLAATAKHNGSHSSSGKNGSPYHGSRNAGYYGGLGYSEGQQPTSSRARRVEQQWQKNYSTFGHVIEDEDITADFDFESNNKLFDKQAVAKEIDLMKQEHLHQQPDIISQTDHRHRNAVNQQPQQPNKDQRVKASERQPEPKYRCDQNVIEGSKDAGQIITLPSEEPAELVYATDSGFLVPCVSLQLRQRLLTNAVLHGFSITRQNETTARATAELCMQLLGGDHRLNSKNSHQVPRVVVLCGSHQQGSLGLNTARQLHTHDVLTTALTPAVAVTSSLAFSHELKLFQLTGGEVAHSTAQLDANAAIDLILDARLDHKGCPGNDSSDCTEWGSEVTAWARRQRCPVLALDPPGHEHAVSTNLSLPARALVVSGLPLAYSEQQGIVHLIKLALPKKFFHDIGISYCSPFQAKFMVTLHPCE